MFLILHLLAKRVDLISCSLKCMCNLILTNHLQMFSQMFQISSCSLFLIFTKLLSGGMSHLHIKIDLILQSQACLMLPF